MSTRRLRVALLAFLMVEGLLYLLGRFGLSIQYVCA